MRKFSLILCIVLVLAAESFKFCKVFNGRRQIHLLDRATDGTEQTPVTIGGNLKDTIARSILFGSIIGGGLLANSAVAASENADVSIASPPSDAAVPVDFEAIKVPYNHVNIPFSKFLGKATIVFNLKLDDPQTSQQFPNLLEIYKKYKADGLNVLAFPTEQGWFEPDDDETVRAKALEYYGFGDFPNAVVFDKVDLLGPSAQPLYNALTNTLPTPNGYGRITLNYEKFLLDGSGKPLRRYPRKYSAYEMETDIVAVLKGEALPEETPLYQKYWREAKRELVKSEYSFRYNYNYYTAPDSMYKYNPKNDV